MSLSNLFSKLTKKPGEEKENFLAIEINNEAIRAVVWVVVDGKIEIVRYGSIEEWEKVDDFLKAADSTITSAIEGVSPEPNKAIFGLPLDWVKGESILPDKKLIIADLCEKMALKPVGFVVSLEALITYLKMEQGTPPSAVFVQLGETEIIVSLVKLGKALGSHKVGRSGDLALDIKEGLARFKETESLPARIILFDGLTDFEEAKQQIISFEWMTQLPFLHIPRVDSLERDFVMKSIAIAGGSEVARSLGFQIQQAEEKKTKDEMLSPEESIEEADQEFVQKESVREIKEFEEKEIQDSGFIQEADIREVDNTVKVKTVAEFAIENQPVIEPEKKVIFPSKTNFKLDFINKIMTRLINLTKSILKRRIFILILPLLLLLTLPAAAYFYLLKAQIILYFESQQVQEKLVFYLDPKANSPDFEKAVLPAEEIKTEVEGIAEIPTTGEKLTGEKAKGEVSIYNKTNAVKTFSTGTVLVGESNLKFVLDEEATIASSSSQERSGGEEIIWGKVKAKISAASVGEESNLKAGSNFTFKDYSSSSFSAITEEGLGGGSSKKVKTVTAQDKKQLSDKLTAELEEKGRENLKSQAAADKLVLDKILESKISQKKYDKETGDEADKLKLNLKLSLATMVFSQKDIKQITLESLEKSIPGDFTLSEDDLQTEISGVESKEGRVRVELIVKAGLTPKVDEEKIKSELAGKSEDKAKNYLLSLPNLKRAKINISPLFLGNLKTLPKRAQNIKIELQVD